MTVLFKDSWAERNRMLVSAATLGAQGLHGGNGFRLRDLRFLVDLFANWCNESSEYTAKLQNMQLLRWLVVLGDEGYARRRSREKHPLYLLTRSGFLYLLEQIRAETNGVDPDPFLFKIMFLDTYRERIISVLSSLGKNFSRALRDDVGRLCDTRCLISDELRRISDRIRRLEERMTEARNCSSLVKRLSKEGASTESILSAIENRYPYELSNQRSLTDLLSLIPDTHRLWEVSTAAEHRSGILWEGQLVQLRSYAATLDRLLSQDPAVVGSNPPATR